VLVTFAVAGLGLMLSLRALSVTGVPVRSASLAAMTAALDLLDLREGERFVDLGCGHGNVLAEARRRTNVHALGFELNPAIALLAWLRCLGDRRVEVRCGDSRQADLTGVGAFYAYLMPRPMLELEAWLSRFPEGTRLVSVEFALPNLVPVATREVGLLRQPVRLYVLGPQRI
jgi:SAM-dependent methyltransferase